MKRILIIITTMVPLMAMEVPSPVQKDTGEILEQAIRANDLDAIQKVLLQGVNVRRRNHLTGETMLHLAVKTDNPRIVNILLAKGDYLDIYAEDNSGQSPTTLAYQRNIPEVIALLETAAQHKQKFEKLAVLTPGKEIKVEYIMKAIKDNNRSMVNDMLKQAPQLLNEQELKAGATLLHHAARPVAKVEILEDLLVRGANPNIPNKKMQTPLHSAAWHNDEAKVSLLLANTANPNAQNDEGNTPLHDAAFRGNQNIVAILVLNGANVDSRNNAGNTPMHMAAKNDQPVIVQQLTESFADQNIRNNEGKTPKDLATEKVATLFTYYLKPPKPEPPNPR